MEQPEQEQKQEKKSPGARRFSISAPDDQEDVVETEAKLRESFQSGKTKSEEWRRQQLRQCMKMIKENRKAFEEALYKDMKRSAPEAFLTAFSLIEGEIKYHLKNLKRNMRARKKSTSLLTFPAKSLVHFDPLGVVLVLGPNNFPLQLLLVPMIGAIASGNCVIVKPGSNCHAVSRAINEMVSKYLDTDCIAVVEGPRDITTQLLEIGDLDKVFFTGSTNVGRIVAQACAKHLTPCTLELGGKSPTVIDQKCNINLAAKRVCFSSFVNSGQLCVRTDHIFVHKNIKDKFIQALKLQIKKMYGEDVASSDSYCRMVTPVAAQRLESIIQKESDHVISGGTVNVEEKFVEPTLLDYGDDFDAFKNSEAMKEELFGPIVPIVSYENLSDVIEFINNLPTGKPLTMNLFSDDSKVKKKFLKSTTSGSLNINDASAAVVSLTIPFGGVGNSGQGRYHGFYTFECFSHEKAVLDKRGWLDELPVLMRPFQDARFPPYTSFRTRVVRLLS